MSYHKLLRLLFSLLLITAVWSCKKENKPKGPEEAEIILFQGEVMTSVNGTDWQAVKSPNVKIKKNEWLATGTKLGTLAKLKIWDGSIVVLTMDSKIQLQELTDKQQFKLKLEKGQVSCNVQKISGDGYFQVQTQAFVAGVRGTGFNVTAKGDKESLLVNEGAVAVKRTISGAPEKLVKAGQGVVFSVSENEKLKKKVSTMDEEQKKKELEFPVKKAGDIENELPEDMKKELKKTQEFINKASKGIDRTVEEKSKAIDETVKKQSKAVDDLQENTFKKDATDMNADDLLKNKRTTKPQDNKANKPKRPSLDLDKVTE